MSGEVSVESLKELWEAGALDMPTVGQQYSTAANSLHDTRYYDMAFTTSLHGQSPLFRDFDNLRSLFQDRILVKSSQNCEKVGEVLMKIADSFANRDHLNAKDLEEYKTFKDPDKRKSYEEPKSVGDASSSDEPLANPQD